MEHNLSTFNSKGESYAFQSEERAESLEVMKLPNEEVQRNQDNCLTHATAQVAMDVRASKVQSSNLALEFDVGDEVRITGNWLLLCDNKAKSLLVYRTSGQYKQTVSLLSYPFDLTVLSNKQIAAVSFQRENYIQFLDISTASIIAGCKKCLIRSCTGGISSYQDNIVVCTEETIDIYNSDCVNLLRTVSLPQFTENPYSIKCLPQYFAIANGKSVYIYDSNLMNDRLVDYECTIRTNACSLSLDSQDNIYFIERDNDILYRQCIKDEKYVGLARSIELRTSKHGLYGPCAICLSEDFSKIYISNNDGQSIYICSLSK